MQINDPFFNRQVEHLVGLALAAHARQQNPQQVLQRYAADPATRLSANIAQGIVAQQLAAVNNQQGLQAGAAAAQTPTVLDQMEMQGLAGVPMGGGAFDPGLYEQGIGDGLGLNEEEAQGPVAYGARGGVVAFAGEGPSFVQAGGGLSQAELDQIARERLLAERYKPTWPDDPDVARTPETPEAKAAREARTKAAGERVAARTPPASPAAEPPLNEAQAKDAKKIAKLDEKISDRVNRGKDVSKLVAQRAELAGGVRGAIPGPVQVTPQGIAAPGPTAPPVVQAVTPQAPPAPAAAPAAKPTIGERAKDAAKDAAKGAGRVGSVLKWGGVAPIAAGLAEMGGQYVGEQLNKYTPIQESLRNAFTSSTEDEANRVMQPGYIPGRMQQSKVGKEAGISPMVGNIADIVSGEESGGNFASTASLGRVNPGNTSFGSFQLDVSGGLPAFVKEHGAAFGLTAKMGTPEFATQWKAAAEKDPVRFGAAQLKAFETGYLNPTRTHLTSLLPGAPDPRVLTYFTSRGVQLGPDSTKRDGRVITEMFNNANGDVPKFLEAMSAYDAQNYEKYFRGESRKATTDRSKYDYAANERRITQRLNNALGTTAGERMVQRGERVVEVGKDVADVVAQQPPVQRLAALGVGLRTKATDALERAFPIKTGLEPKPAEKPTADQAKTVQEFMQNEANIRAAQEKASRMATNKQERDDIAMALMMSGAAAMAGVSPHAMANLGAGFSVGLKGYMDRQTKREEQALKARENELNRSEKRFANLIKMKTAQLKSRLPELTDPEEREARAYYEVLSVMSPQELANQGLTRQDVLNAKAALGGGAMAKVDSSMWGKPTVVGG